MEILLWMYSDCSNSR